MRTVSEIKGGFLAAVASIYHILSGAPGPHTIFHAQRRLRRKHHDLVRRLWNTWHLSL